MAAPCSRRLCVQVVVGKGGDWLFPHLCHHLSLQPGETCIVGDRLDTDIALGRAGGLRTILPLTGVCTQADVAAADAGARPDFVVPSLAALADVGVPAPQTTAAA
jgi:ribonucleotide monophosphatase NagD (HAD superfamily)